MIRLKTDVEYQWVVALVVDPKRRARDIVASSFIKRVKSNGPAKPRAAEPDLDVQALEAASKGYWYDAVSTLCRRIEQKGPQSPQRLQLAALVAQAGLDEVAAHERYLGSIVSSTSLSETQAPLNKIDS